MVNQNYFMGLDGFVWFVGVVEDRNDPDELGRARVRCLGFHTENLVSLPTADLPWAHVMHPVTDPSMHGMGHSPSWLVEGSWVVGFFRDAEEKQQPIIIGTIPGVPEFSADYRRGFSDPRHDESWQLNDAGDKLYATHPEKKNEYGPYPLGGRRRKATGGGTTTTGASEVAVEPADEYPTKETQSGPSDGLISDEKIQKAADAAGISVELMKDVLRRESNSSHFDKNGKVIMGDLHLATGQQAYGAMQIRQPALSDYNTHNKTNYTLDDLNDLDTNLKVGAGYLAILQNAYHSKFHPNTNKDDYAYVAYRWGPNPPIDAIISESEERPYHGIAVSADAPGSVQDMQEELANAKKEGGSSGSGSVVEDEETEHFTRFSGHTVGETDTSRLGRGVVSETHAALDRRRKQRRTEIPTATRPHIPTVEDKSVLGTGVVDPMVPWNEPHPKSITRDTEPYVSAQYPYNHVYESESGHLMEIDDTAAGERLHREHMSGTFEEWHPLGDKVVKVVGHNYEIIAKSSNVLISGNVNVTIEGTKKELIMGDYILEVLGDYTRKIHGSERVKIGAGAGPAGGGTAGRAAGGNLETEINGNYSYNINGAVKGRVGKNQDVEIEGHELRVIEGNYVQSITGNISQESITGSIFWDAQTAISQTSVGITTIKSGNNLNIKSVKAMDIHTEGEGLKITSGDVTTWESTGLVTENFSASQATNITGTLDITTSDDITIVATDSNINLN